MERRKFTQLLSLTGLGLVSNNYILGGIFDNLPPAQQDFILACGIHPDTSSIKPGGNHIRWYLPPAKGFPDTITIYRRQVAKDPIIPIFTPSPENLAYLTSICEEKNNKGWVAIGKIDNKRDFADQSKMFTRLKELEAVNAFLPAGPANVRDIKLQQYEALLTKYIEICKALKNPQASYFDLTNISTSLPEIPINELAFKSRTKNGGDIKPWSFLALAAIDPNIAIMLGFYFVDQTVPNPGDHYDYKIEAHYEKTNKFICGVARQVSKENSFAPVLTNNLISTQVGNTNWKGDTNYLQMKQTGNVRLSWKAPVVDNNNLRSRYTDTVLYPLKRNNESTRRISPAPDNLQHTFSDREVGIGIHNYQVMGVDIFGQKSNILTSTCEVKDKSIPAAATRLSFLETGSTLQLQFEYSGSQYLQAPDIKKFKVYQRNDTVTDSLKATFTLIADNAQIENSDFEYSIQVNSSTNLAGFEWLHFIQSADNKKLRASARKKFRIRSIAANKVSFTCSIPNYTPPSNGWVLLSKTPGTKSAAWVSVREINFKPPTVGEFPNNTAYTHFKSGTTDAEHFAGSTITANKAFNCLGAFSKIGGAEPDLFETNTGETPPTFTEIILNRTLPIADIFSKGKVKVNNVVYPIEIQSAGIAAPSNIQSILANDIKKKNNYARILVKDSITVPANASIQLIPPVTASGSNTANKMEGYVVMQANFPNTVTLQPTGELLLTANYVIRVGIEEQMEQINVIARVCSDFYTSGSQKEVLVHIDKKIKSIDTTTGMLWFAPYQVNITTLVKDPAMPLLASEAHKSAYFAVEAIDTATPEKAGPLSSIAQFIKTRAANARPIKPQPPFPCGNETATEAFLTIPNKEGRSTFCIAWKDIKNAQGASMGYRYEIGRALDKTIIAVHRDLWLKGRDYNGSDPNTQVTVSSLSITDTNANTGLITVQFSSSQNKVWSRYKGGRLKQTTSTSGTRGFEITRITVSGNNLTAMIRPMIKGTAPVNASFTIDELPDYANIILNTATVKSLSETCESAFSVVTGQPLRNTTQLLDDVPGTGSSRFFYKVRSVDASENRSEWSPASVAVWQLDTTPPDIVLDLGIEYAEKSVRLHWKNVPAFKNSTSFEIFRIESTASPSQPIAANNIIATIPLSTATRKKIYYYNDKIELPGYARLAIPQNASSIELRIAQLLASTNFFLFTPQNPTENLYSTSKFDIQYSIADNQSTLVIIGLAAKEPLNISREQELEIKIGATSIQQNNGFLQYIDKTVVAGKEYMYAVRCSNKIQNLGSVKGAMSPVIKGVKIVSPIPLAPIILQKNWINASNAVITNPDSNSSFRFTAKAQLPIHQYRILRRKQGLQMWENPVINNVSSWQPWGSQTNKIFKDSGAMGLNWEYGIQVVTIDKRTSSITIFSTQNN